jgi:hypothetical protein
VLNIFLVHFKATLIVEDAAIFAARTKGVSPPYMLAKWANSIRNTVVVWRGFRVFPIPTALAQEADRALVITVGEAANSHYHACRLAAQITEVADFPLALAAWAGSQVLCLIAQGSQVTDLFDGSCHGCSFVCSLPCLQVIPSSHYDLKARQRKNKRTTTTANDSLIKTRTSVHRKRRSFLSRFRHRSLLAVRAARV